MSWRPCGACRSLVPADDGCAHWSPGLTARAIEGRARRARERAERQARRDETAASVAAFTRMFRLGEA